MLMNFKDLIQKYNLKITGVIIAGAHHGNEIPTYLNEGIEKIIAFEPCNLNHKELKKNYGNNKNIEIWPFALGSASGEIEMYIETANQGQSNSILEPKLHLEQYKHIKFHIKEMVFITTLDKVIFSDFEMATANFLDIDTQGYELEVLKGATETLKTIDYIYTEVYRDNVYHGNPMISEIDDFLLPFGFTRVETNWDGQTWGDAFYIKSKI